MVKQYYIYPDGHSKQREFVEITSPSHYDDPVDRSQFRPDSENTRMFRLSGSGSEGTPIYDKEGDFPSDLEVNIRSGKLDKAEISQLEMKRAEEMKENISEMKKKKIQEEKEKISEARQDFLDKSTGFKGSNQSETI